MLAFIKGKIKTKTDRFAIVQANDIGYKVYCPVSTLNKLEVQKEAEFFTHLYLREGVMDLYGFLTFEEMDFFETLISVRGIGPKASLSILSLAPVKTVKQAIASGQKSLLTKVSGIGNKTAERVILELKNKVVMPVAGIRQLSFDSEVIEALVSLGYTISQARQALEQVPENIKIMEKRIKEALKILGKKR
jgi:Holliday junction DNA helicase RuvA